MKNSDTDYKEAIQANIDVHSAMADDYNTIEPHFRKESIDRVKEIISELGKEHSIEKVLDLGCGTGFMINILKHHATEIKGVDVTQAMLDKVDTSGDCDIELVNSDTGSVELPDNYYDIATAYTFLDHLHDMNPTFRNCYRSLKDGGVFYADLSPNSYFWEEIKHLPKHLSYDPIINREINAVTKKDEEIEAEFGVKSETFVKAEYQKHVEGGLNEERIEAQLKAVGFKEVRFIYHWFLGQAQLVNDPSRDKAQNLEYAQIMHNVLVKSLPLSRHLFKYIGFVAIK